MCVLSALTNNGTVSMRLIAIGNAFHNRGPTTLNERSPKLTSFVRGTSNRCCCEERVRPVEHCLFSMSARYRGAVPFDRKPMQLLYIYILFITGIRNCYRPRPYVQPPFTTSFVFFSFQNISIIFLFAHILNDCAFCQIHGGYLLSMFHIHIEGLTTHVMCLGNKPFVLSSYSWVSMTKW